MDKRDEVMKTRGEAYAAMEAQADAFLAEIVDSPDVDTNILLTLFALSREAAVRRQIADELEQIANEDWGSKSSWERFEKLLEGLRGNK